MFIEETENVSVYLCDFRLSLSGLPLIKDHLIEHARKRIKDMERLSPILKTTIDKYQQIKHIKENASTLDVIEYRGSVGRR